MVSASGGSSKSNVCLLRPPANVFFITHMTHRPKGPRQFLQRNAFCEPFAAGGGGGGADACVIVTGTGRTKFFIFQQTASKFFAKIFCKLPKHTASFSVAP